MNHRIPTTIALVLLLASSVTIEAQPKDGRVRRFDSTTAHVVWRGDGVIRGVHNFQHFGGFGVRWAPLRGPGLTIELRNHHISNAGTAGENLGINAGTIVAGVQWILRKRQD